MSQQIQSHLSPGKRIAVVYMLSERGGVQNCVLATIRGLNDRGIVPDVMWDEPPLQALLQEAGVRAGYSPLRFRIPSRQIKRLPDTLRYLAWMTNIVEGDRVLAGYDGVVSFYNGFLVPQGMPHIYFLSGPPLLPQLEVSPGLLRGLPIRFFRALYRRVLRGHLPVFDYHRGCRYVINSKYTAALFAEAHGVSLPVVYPPIELGGRSFDFGDLAGRDSLVFFSRIVDYKRPELVIELARRHRHLRCVIMGGLTPNRQRYFRRLQSLASESGVTASFLPNPTDSQVREELARARYYVFPAIGEHFGMTTPEAIASGALPFVHDSGGQREIVPDERLRFADDQIHKRFEWVLSLSEAEHNELRRALSTHVQQFSSERFVRELLSNFGGS